MYIWLTSTWQYWKYDENAENIGEQKKLLASQFLKNKY